jgi:MFS family permease
MIVMGSDGIGSTTESQGRSAAAERDPRRWFALVAIAAAQFMVVFDIAIVNLALPSIGKDLKFAQQDLQWVISAYAIVFGGFLLRGGRLADLWGRRRMFMAGVILFSISSLLCGLAWSEGSLIALRAVQAALTLMAAVVAALLIERVSSQAVMGPGARAVAVGPE